METFTRTLHSFRALIVALLCVAVLSAAAVGQGNGAAKVESKAAPTLTAAERKAAARVKLETIREVTTKLSSPEFEGRGTAQPGGDRAAQYLADRFKAMGLKPAGENGTYLQTIKFKSAEVLPDSALRVGDTAMAATTSYCPPTPQTKLT